MSLRFRIDKLLSKFEKPYDVHNCIEVSGEALRHNAQLFGERSGMAVIPVLKANAYGHGIEIVARSLRSEALPYIAVDGYFEAQRVRTVSRQPVLVMGAIKASNFKHMKYQDFAFVVQHEETVHALGRTGRRLRLHVEVNSGMNRYGVKPAELQKLVETIRKYRNLELEGVMSHLADSDGDDPATVVAAVDIFDKAVELVRKCGAKPRWRHIAQTAGSTVAQSKYANAMRLGLGLYGIDPFVTGSNGRMPGLRPALKLVSTITNIIELKPGDKVSYNYTYTAKKAMRIGVLPLGYYEGVSRALSNAGCVKYEGCYLPIVGRVCMNHTMVDLSGSAAKLGDKVVIYSDEVLDDNAVNRIADNHGIFNYNLLTSLSPDVRRIAKD
jgi:alanine racemase